jgi:hypothetical protein
MSYFNHAFQKVFIATGTQVTTGDTSDLTAGTYEFGIFDPKSYAAINTATPPTTPTSFIFASSSIYSNDKIGPFHGGYQESNKSKLINPRYVTKLWKVVESASTQSLTIVGKTDNAGTDACDCPVFSCGKTYRLRIDIKGSPALRFLNHEVYTTLDANTGCCADPALPNNVDPVTVFIQWAKQIIEHPYLSQFVSPTVIYSLNGGSTWQTPLTTVAAMDAYTPVAAGDIDDVCVGVELTGAYVDTVFGDCSFKPTDHFEKEPIQIYASFVDDINDPCQSESLCVTQVTRGQQGQGYPETVIRDLILSESYSQNYFSCNPRIREITQGNAIYDAIDRSFNPTTGLYNTKYNLYYIQHNVPRFNNPSGTFDNDQYLLKIVVPSGTNAAMDDIIDWIEGACLAAGNEITIENF